MGYYKVVRVVERISYVEASSLEKAQSPIKADFNTLIEDENLISSTVEEVEKLDVAMYWANKNDKRFPNVNIENVFE